MASCLRKTWTVLSVAKALVCRGMFVLHSLICIWRVTVIKSSVLYWSLAGSLPLIILETIYTVYKKKHGEWKWVCPSVLLYLSTSVPAIWFLELDVMTHREQRANVRHDNLTTSHVANESEQIHLLNGQIHLDISLGSEEWCKVLEQILLLVLIVGRWLLPKGDITREQLSQLLLVYIGMAADIIELFEAFKEDKVRQNKLLNMTILSLWTASLTQFTLVLTATKSKQRRTRGVVSGEGGGAASCTNGVKGCCPVEVLSILLSVFLQDAPFLVLRMLLIFRYNVLSYSNIFFTSKNSLVLMLQIYRLIVLFTDSPGSSATKTSRSRDRHAVVTTGSSRSNSLSLNSDTEGSSSDDSDIGNHTSEGSDWTKLDRFKGHRGSPIRRDKGGHPPKSDSRSSFETDQDSIPGTSWMDRRTVLVMTSPTPHPDSTPRPKGKGKIQKRSSGGLWVCRYQHRPSRTKRSQVNREKIFKKGQGLSTNDSLSSGVPPPPGPMGTRDLHQSIDSNSSSNNNNNNNNNNKAKTRPETKSPKASPSRGRSDQSKDNKHLHDNSRYHGDDPTTRHREDDDRRSRHHRWSTIKGLQSALSLLEEKGKYSTVVLKHAGDGTPVYVIDHSKHDGHVISV